MSDNSATFTHGSTLKHVVVMTSTAAIGLMTLFIVDLVDMFFLSLLGEVELAAAIGYAGTILFFTTAVSIGIAIATGALVSRSIGADNEKQARKYAINVMVFGVITASCLSTAIWLNISFFLEALGATGVTKTFASDYLKIIIPSMAILTIAMSASGVLRATGDAKRAMLATVIGGLVNLVLDPIFIFALDMGVKGAAYASVASRIAVACFALHACIKVHALIGRWQLKQFLIDLPNIIKIAIPSMLTNVATPIGNAYVMATIASFGDSAVAGMSIIGRLIPVAFGIVFALSGAVGPIVGQNFGANHMDRVKQTLIDAIKFATLVVSSVCLILFLSQDMIIGVFKVSGDAAQLISLFSTWIAFTFLFNGFLFIANAAFNNLGYPHYSTAFNFLKATLGTIPFVYIGAKVAQQSGALIGQGIGSIIVGCLALYLCFKVVDNIQNTGGKPPRPHHNFHLRFPRWALSNTRG